MQPLEKEKDDENNTSLFYIILPLFGSYCDASPIVSLATSLGIAKHSNVEHRICL
jgi:hypothetical protein